MDAPWWTAEPGGLPSDREHEPRPTPDEDDPNGLTCADCGTGWTWGFSSLASTGKVLCQDCKYRRGSRYLFDPRPWSVIARELKGDAA